MTGPRFRLILREVKPRRLVYAVSPGFRLLFLGIALLILLALLSGSSPSLLEPSNTFALILFLVCILASLYRERWIFDTELDLLEQQTGFLPLYQRKTHRLSGIDRVVLDSHWVGGRAPRDRGRLFNRGFVVLALSDREGNVQRLEIGRHLQAGGMRRTGEKIAAFCGVPFVESKAAGGADGKADRGEQV